MFYKPLKSSYRLTRIEQVLLDFVCRRKKYMPIKKGSYKMPIKGSFLTH